MREHLIQTKCGVFPNPKKFKHRKSLEKPIALDPSRSHKIIVTWVETPDAVSVIETQNFTTLRGLEKKLQRAYTRFVS